MMGPPSYGYPQLLWLCRIASKFICIWSNSCATLCILLKMKSFYKSNTDRREPRWGCDVAAKCTRCRTWTTRRVVVLFKEALVGFQGRGFVEVTQPHCCHPLLLEALIFQWP